MVHANHYLISREPDLYPQSHEFKPERWLDPSWPTYKEPLTEFPTIRGDPAFGYGTRSCPGTELVAVDLSPVFNASITVGKLIQEVQSRVGDFKNSAMGSKGLIDSMANMVMPRNESTAEAIGALSTIVDQLCPKREREEEDKSALSTHPHL